MLCRTLSWGRVPTLVWSHEAVEAEGVSDVGDLACHVVGGAHEQRTALGTQGGELVSGHGAPASLAADAAHGCRIRRIEVGDCLFVGFGYVPVGVDRHRLRFVAALFQGAVVEIDQRLEAGRLAADDGDGQGEAEKACADYGFGAAAYCDPDRQRPVLGARVDHRVGQRGSELAGPGERAFLADLQQQGQLLFEQFVVVGEVVAEEGEGFGERSLARPSIRRGRWRGRRGWRSPGRRGPGRRSSIPLRRWSVGCVRCGRRWRPGPPRGRRRRSPCGGVRLRRRRRGLLVRWSPPPRRPDAGVRPRSARGRRRPPDAFRRMS